MSATKDKETPSGLRHSNDSFWHLPFILLLVLGAVVGSQYVTGSFKSANDEAQSELLKKEYEGYQKGVLQSR